MRIHFQTLSRPKRVAKGLTQEFEGTKLAVAQRWAAVIYGYRSWSELELVTKRRAEPPSPDDEDLDGVARLMRFDEQVTKLQQCAGCAREMAVRVIATLAPTARTPASAAIPEAAPVEAPKVARRKAVSYLPPPSEMQRFLYIVNHGKPDFRATAFAGYLQLSALEARTVLEQYRQDGLVGYCGMDDDIDCWEVTKTGYYTFLATSQLGKRMTKERLGQCLQALAQFAAAADLSGAQRVVVGGAWLDGQAHGPFLLGFETPVAPYSVPEHRKLAEVAHATFYKEGIGTTEQPPPFFFHRRIPGRLARYRPVIDPTVPTLGPVVEAKLVDWDEAEHQAGLALLAKDHGFRPGFGKDMHHHGGVFRSLLGYPLAFEDNVRHLPVRGTPAPTKLRARKPEPGPVVAGLTEEIRLQCWDSMRGSVTYRMDNMNVLAEADYFDQRGLLTPERATNLLKERRFAHQRTLLHAAPIEVLRAAVEVERADVLALREQRAKRAKRRPPARVAYEVFFDVLNFSEPMPVGMARQPLSQNKAFRELIWFWDRRIDAMKLPTCAFSDIGYVSPAYYSLASRPASESEIAAYDTLRAKHRGMQQFVFMSSTDAHTMGTVLLRHGFPLNVPLPMALRNVVHHGKLRPHLVYGYLAEQLYAVLAKLPKVLPNARQWLLDLRKLPIGDFVERAHAQSNDPLVRAVSAGEEWHYETAANGWTARIGADDWEVRLEGKGPQNLTLTVRLGAERARHVLAPRAAPKGYEDMWTPYRGLLADLVGFLRRMRIAHSEGIEEMTRLIKGTVDPITFGSEKERFRALVRMADWALSDRFPHFVSEEHDDLSDPNWPSLLTDKEADEY